MATVNIKTLPDTFDKKPAQDITLTPLAEGSVKVKKDNAWQKAKKVLFAESADNAFRYLVTDVFVPAVIDLLAGGTKKFIDYIFYGGSAGSRSSGTKTSYTAYYQSGNSSSKSSSRQIPLGDVETIAFVTEPEAQKVLTDLRAYVDRYGTITYDYFKEYTGRSKEINYTDKHMGWTNLKNCDIHRINDPEFHWALEMPPLERVE